MKNRKGYALVTSLLFCSILLSMSVPYLNTLLGENYSTNSRLNTLRAQALAEAGMEEVFWEYNYGGGNFTGRGWSGDATKTKTATVTDSSGKTAGTYTTSVSDYAGMVSIVTVTGTSTGVPSMSVTMMAKIGSQGLYSAAIRSGYYTILQSRALVDSYSGDTDSWLPANRSSNGYVLVQGSKVKNPYKDFDGNLILISQSTLKGNAATTGKVYMYTRPDLKPDPVLTGTKTENLPTDPVPEVSIPPSLQAQLDATPNQGVKSYVNTTLNWTGGVQRMSRLSVAGSDINVTGSNVIYIDNDFNFNCYTPPGPNSWKNVKNSLLTINQGADLTIYCTSATFFQTIAYSPIRGVRNLNTEANPQTFVVNALSSNPTVNYPGIYMYDMKSFIGLLNAPQGEINMQGQNELYGAAIANSVSLYMGGNIASLMCAIHYNEALKNRAPYAPGARKLGWVRRAP